MLRTLALLTAAVLVAGCASLHGDPPQVTLVGIEPATGEGEGLEARMLMKLRVQNPNDAPIPFHGIYIELDVMNKSLGTGVSDQSGTVPAFGETVVTVPLTVSVLSIVGQAVAMMSAGRVPDKVPYAMRGKLSGTHYGALRFESRGEVALPATRTATAPATGRATHAGNGRAARAG